MDVVVTPAELTLDPTYSVCEAIFNQVMNLWQDYAVNVKSFIGDKVCMPFTKLVNIIIVKLGQKKQSCHKGSFTITLLSCWTN